MPTDHNDTIPGSSSTPVGNGSARPERPGPKRRRLPGKEPDDSYQPVSNRGTFRTLRRATTGIGRAWTAVRRRTAAENRERYTTERSKFPFKNLAFRGALHHGTVYIGAIQYLEKKGFLQQIEEVSGTSSGSFVAIILAMGGDVSDLECALNKAAEGKFATVKRAEEVMKDTVKQVLTESFKKLAFKKLASLDTFAEIHPEIDKKINGGNADQITLGELDTICQWHRYNCPPPPDGNPNLFKRFKGAIAVDKARSQSQEVVLSAQDFPDMPVWMAARASSAIDLLAVAPLSPVRYPNPTGREYVLYDGGLAADRGVDGKKGSRYGNSPAGLWENSDDTLLVAAYSGGKKKKRSGFRALGEAVFDRHPHDDSAILDEHKERAIFIKTGDLGFPSLPNYKIKEKVVLRATEEGYHKAQTTLERLHLVSPPPPAQRAKRRVERAGQRAVATARRVATLRPNQRSRHDGEPTFPFPHTPGEAPSATVATPVAASYAGQNTESRTSTVATIVAASYAGQNTESRTSIIAAVNNITRAFNSNATAKEINSKIDNLNKQAKRDGDAFKVLEKKVNDKGETVIVYCHDNLPQDHTITRVIQKDGKIREIYSQQLIDSDCMVVTALKGNEKNGAAMTIKEREKTETFGAKDRFAGKHTSAVLDSRDHSKDSLARPK